jgi:hypothetical protein
MPNSKSTGLKGRDKSRARDGNKQFSCCIGLCVFPPPSCGNALRFDIRQAVFEIRPSNSCRAKIVAAVERGCDQSRVTIHENVKSERGGHLHSVSHSNTKLVNGLKSSPTYRVHGPTTTAPTARRD